MLSAYWPVWNFDTILAIPNLLSITARHLPLFQCIYAAFRTFVFPVRFAVPLCNVISLQRTLQHYTEYRSGYWLLQQCLILA